MKQPIESRLRATTLTAALVLLGAWPATSGATQDWASFRGNLRMTGIATMSPPLTTTPRLLWTYETGSSVESTAAIVNDTVYVGTMTNALLAIDLKTGRLRWKFVGAGPISASPAVAGGLVYVGDESGRFSRSTGNRPGSAVALQGAGQIKHRRR